MWWKKIQLNYPFWIALVFIIGLALFTRFYALGQAPAGITWDEAALGYVGKMVVQTSRDEHLKRFPISFQSFGDYKSPLSFYVVGASTTILGLSPWAVRLPFALAGLASVGSIIWLTWRVIGKPWYALLAGFLITVLPWHFLFSRIAFEAGLNTMFFLLMLVGWLEARQTDNKKLVSSKYGFALMIIGATASLYTYHAAKVATPLTLLLIAGYEIWFNRNWLREKRNAIALSILGLGMLSLPLIWDTLFGLGATRGLETTFVGKIPINQTIQLILQNFAAHLDFDFLLWGSTTSYRHGTPDYGVFFIGHLIFFWLGITFVIGRQIQSWRLPNQPTIWTRISNLLQLRSTYQPAQIKSWFWLILLIITILPATIGTEIPHANRALLAVVPAVMLMTLGARELQEELKPQAFASILGTIILLIGIQFSSFWSYYFSDYQKASSADWLEGHMQAVQIAQEYQQAEKQIKFSSMYGQPFTFYAFYNQIPFETYRQFRIPGIDFGPVSLDDWNVYDVIITTPYDSLPFEPSSTIYRQDDQAAFYVYEVE